jgi:AraC family transcriptional regulator
VKIEIVERQPVRVAYQRYTGPAGGGIGRFWRATVAPWLADHGMLDCPRYGVSLDNPRETLAENCRYDACVELPRGIDIPGAEQTTIAGGSYAIAFFKGTGAEIGAAWAAFVAATLADAPNKLDEQRHPFEHYPRGAVFDAKTGVFACELCIPLRS